MTTNQIASRLVELCRKGEFETAQKELFAKDAMSIEPQASGAFEKETKGLNAILEKGKKWDTKDFGESNWNLRKWLWWPQLRMFGIQPA